MSEPDAVDMGDNEVFAVDNPDKSMPVVDLIRICGSEGIHRSELSMFRAPFTDFLDPETGQGQAHPDYVYGAHAVEVAVDVDTRRGRGAEERRPPTMSGSASTPPPWRARSRAAPRTARGMP